MFSYANVPYRIRSFADIVADPKQTVDYDYALAARIDERVAAIGADGKLVLDADGDVYQVNLLEKLLVPLLAKLGNLVLDGGIWLNTQRPEWNDANNALVGHGVSMVTLCYMRRYVRFLQDLLAGEQGRRHCRRRWRPGCRTPVALASIRPWLGKGPSARTSAGARCRTRPGREPLPGVGLSRPPFTGKVALPFGQIPSCSATPWLRSTTAFTATVAKTACITHTTCSTSAPGKSHRPLYLMLEGQVAALSSGAIAPDAAAALVESLFASDLYRADQHSFMLYPDRPLPGFLEKNRVPADGVERSRCCGACWTRATSASSRATPAAAIDSTPTSGTFATWSPARCLGGTLRRRPSQASRDPLRELYETVFKHREFTGRSGTMFGFEGLGCIYWHMVSKLLLAVQENFFAALEGDAGRSVCRHLGEPVLPRAGRHRLQQDAGRVRRLPDGPLLAHARARRARSSPA